MKNRYRSVIIGCGGRGRMHALAYNHVLRSQMVACCDRNSENLQAFSEEFNIKPYDDAAEMLIKEKPDIVHLVTNPKHRVELMRLVDQHGIPGCIVEKPVALGVKDWHALVDLEKESKTKFVVGAQFRYHPDLLHCQNAIQKRDAGKVRFLDSSAVGTICDQGVHVLDWAMSLNVDSPVKRVFGTASGSKNMSHPIHPSPDTTCAQLLFENGVYAFWNLGYSAPRVFQADTYYKHCRVAAYFDKGHVLYEEFGRWEILTDYEKAGGHVDDRGWLEGNHLAQANLTNAMFDWLEDDAKPAGTHLRRALDQWNVILGLYASAVWMKPVELPFHPPEDLWEQLFLRLAESIPT